MKKGGVAIVIAVVIVLLWQAKLQRGASPGEATAIGSLLAIHEAQSAYATVAGHGGYAGSLAVLATPCPATKVAFVSPDLASDPVMRAGYEIALRRKPAAATVAVDCNGAPTFTAYYATTKPLSKSAENRRAFAIDETGTLWYDASGKPPAPPFKGHRSLR